MHLPKRDRKEGEREGTDRQQRYRQGREVRSMKARTGNLYFPSPALGLRLSVLLFFSFILQSPTPTPVSQLQGKAT